MKVGVLTSSRADYGIYLPLLNELKTDSFFELEIIAFGTHISKSHGYTVKEIRNDKFHIIHEVDSLGSDDSPKGIALSYSNTVSQFASFWDTHRYDLVFCLGDRFEMSAAVQASIPFGVKFAHLHGGETTLGAIDNIYRHQISLASYLHFTATEEFKVKLTNLLGDATRIYNVGALSLDGIKNFHPRERSDLFNEFQIPDSPFALVTFHPETVAIELNASYAKEMKKALEQLAETLNIVITMPNADTLGSIFRKEINNLKAKRPDAVVLVENFGKHNYFSAMYYAELLIGNTSSGIIEAASFGKYVVNVGNRQKGRARGENVKDVAFIASEIFERTQALLDVSDYTGENIYYKSGTAEQIIKTIKTL